MQDALSFVRERTWAQVDLDAVRRNFDVIRRTLRPGARLCCVVKANAYGHGACKLAPLYQQWGADWFAVSNVQEAMQLRRCGITRPVLILGYTAPECAPLLAQHRLSQCVYSTEYATQLSAFAVEAGVTVNIHIKLDTGMGRIGFVCTDLSAVPAVAGEVCRVCCLPGLHPEGVFTHFPSADEGEAGEAYSRQQYTCFTAVIETAREQGITFALRHCANSAALSDYPDWQLDMVRAGIVLYGLQPSCELRCRLALQPAMSLHSVVSHVKEISAGTAVSYGRTFVADRPMRVATVPIGYADGFWRHNGSAGVALAVNGHPASIVGRVCMDQLMVDVTALPPVSIGDPVVVFGPAPALTAQQLAEKNGTIPYEIVCAVGERVPRLYLQDGQVVDVLDKVME
ncbi:MAG: alanine racemase [Clostridia bacterium]|nr:alanine racemase [Clostridia bacterium]